MTQNRTDEHGIREDRTRSALESQGIDLLVATPGTNLVWLSGLSLHRMLRLTAYVLPRDGTPFLVCPSFEESNVRRQLPDIDILPWDESVEPYGLLAGRIVDRFGAKATIGVEPTTWFWQAEKIRAALPQATLRDGGAVLERLRAVKSAHEVACIRRAGDFAEAAAQVARLHLREGLTELEAAEVLVESVRIGREYHEPLVQFGPNSAIPHAMAGERELARGDMVLFDLSGMVEGYLSDITRMSCLGDATPEMKTVYDIVLEAQRAAIAKAGPGVPCEEVDRAARTVITRAGYGEFFTHRTGHGLGLDIHEAPFLVEGNRALLEPGHVITIEPGIYLPGRFGVRIEDDLLITDDGTELLTDGQPSLIETP